MGRISKVIFKEISDYTTKDFIKNYWYRNVFDRSDVDEYEELQLRQRFIRDKNILSAVKGLNVHPKPETSIMGPSLDGKMMILFEVE